MRPDPVPVLWLCGPSGVGKTSVGYEIFAQLGRAGIAGAFVDLDQLGLCYPAPEDDPRNNRLKARNLGEVWSGLRAAGTQCLVVSGIVDDAEEVRRHAGLLPDSVLTVCRLRVDHDELRARIARRGSLLHLTEEIVRNAESLDRTRFANRTVDTAGLTVAEVAALIRAAGWPGHVPASPIPARPAPATAPADPGAPAELVRVPVLWLCGPPAVGKSTVGFEVFLRVLGDGIPAAYLDLAQLGFCRPAPDDDPEHHRLRAYQMGRLWPGFRATGARCLIVSGNVADRETAERYADAIPSGTWTICRLRAAPDTLTERILLRGRGGGPAIAGDALRGRSTEEIHRYAAEAARTADRLDHAGLGDIIVDTDGRDVATLADLVRATAGGWPPPAPSGSEDQSARSVST
jgi:adenylylsulfate kinase-like enzyme